jgi:hypothetical protein
MSAGLMQEFSRALQAAVDQQRQGTGLGNTLSVRHGDVFSVGRADVLEEFRTLETMVPMDKEDVLRNDLGELMEAMVTQTKGFVEQTEALMREMFDEAVESTGNKVTFPKDESPVEAYLEALRMGDFTVVGEGQVIPPLIYFDDPADEVELMRRLAAEMRKPEYRVRVQEIFREKSAEAIRKEHERLSKYEGFGEAEDG